MVDSSVIVAVAQALICAMFVGADRAAFDHVLVDNPFKRVSGHVRIGAGNDAAIASNKPITMVLLSGSSGFAATADQRFIDFDVALERRTAAEIVSAAAISLRNSWHIRQAHL